MSVLPPPIEVASTLAPVWPVFFERSRQAVSGQAWVHLTSWYRDPRRNAAVGGHPLSLHQVGLALDVTAQDPERLISRARSLGWTVVPESDHIHLQAASAAEIPAYLWRLAGVRV